MSRTYDGEMTYRDDAEALRLRLKTLEGELDELRARQRDLRATTARLPDVETELAETRNQLAAQEARRALPLLDRARVASPCNVSWDDMPGNDRIRHCGKCDKNVYNVAFMSRDEAETLLREAEGRVCMRIYRRADGTVLTSDCPVGAQRKRRRNVVAALAIGGSLAAGALYAASDPDRLQQLETAMGIDVEPDDVLMGDMIVDPPPAR
jgi:hypothetical protein